MDGQEHLGQPRALISREALLHNVKVLRHALGPKTKICAMVKADAYGHGARLVADALTNYSMDHLEGPAVDALAVVTMEEAMALGATPVPLMVLRPVEDLYIWAQRETIELALRNGWVLTVSTPAAAADVARIAGACNRPANVQVMLDTGCAREGTPIERFNALLGAIESYSALRLFGLCTHFVSSEEPANPFNAEQLRRFSMATSKPALKNPKVLRHTANSGAIFFLPAAHFDMVRPGIGLYGIDPTCRPSMDRPLRPVLKWVAPLIMLRDLKTGTSVGYNQTWKAERDTRIGLVPVGYADGYLRSFSNRAKMVVHGKAVPVVGRVSMDYVTVDLAGVPEAQLGDEVTILDSDPLSPASAYALAEIANTIPYEVFCHVGQRVRRVAVEPADSEEKAVLWRTAAAAGRVAKSA
ncbi:MAG: alanine racemase [Bacillota bacterium]